MFCRISEDHLSGPGSLGQRLRALPSFTPPPGGWDRLSRRLQARRRQRYAAWGGGFALAASVLVAVALVGVKPDPAPQAASRVATASSAARTTEVAQLISRSQRLEQQLRTARPQVAVWSSGRDARAAMIEQRLRVIDAQLNVAGSATAPALWRDRVTLMNALIELHEPQAPALQYASYSY